MRNTTPTTEAAFLTMLTAHQGIVHKVCKVYTRTAEEHNDLFQDIVVQLWRAWPAFQAGSKVSTWAYRIALNVAISGLRRGRIATEILTDQQYQIPENLPEQNAHADRLYQALHHLSAVEKPLVLLLLEDYSYEEIAHITGLNINHLRVKMHRVREKLRLLLTTIQV